LARNSERRTAKASIWRAAAWQYRKRHQYGSENDINAAAANISRMAKRAVSENNGSSIIISNGIGKSSVMAYRASCGVRVMAWRQRAPGAKWRHRNGQRNVWRRASAKWRMQKRKQQ